MKRLIIITAVLCSFGLLFTGGISFAQYNEWVKGTVGGTYQPRGWNTFEASWFIGYRVWSPVSETLSLGQISNLVIDQSNDRIALVILSDVPGFGAEQVAVPYGSVVRTGATSFQLRIPPNKIGFGDHLDVYLNKYRNAMAPGVLPKVIDASWVTHVYKEYEQFPYWVGKGEKPLTDFYMSRKLMGAEVQAPQGKMLGEVNDLVISSRNGRLVFAIVSCNSGKTAIPYTLLSRKSENTFVLNVTESKLAAAPGFNRYGDLDNRAYATNIYKYFGVEPFWTE